MSNLYTPTPTDPSTVLQVTMPTDGDQRSAQSLRTPLEADTDFIFWLREHGVFNSGTSSGTINHNGTLLIDQIVLPNSGSPTININGNTGFVAAATGFSVEPGAHYYFSAARTFTRVCRTRAKYDVALWAESVPLDARNFYSQQAVANPPDDSYWLEYDVDLPDGCTVTELRCFVDPPAGHSGSLPSLPPRLQLVRQDLTTTVGFTVSAQGADTTAAGSYEAGHEVVVPSLSVSIDGSYQWIVRMRGENGTNAFTGLIAYTPRVKITMPYALEGG